MNESYLKFIRYFIDYGGKEEPTFPSDFVVGSVDAELLHEAEVGTKRLKSTELSLIFNIAADYYTHFEERITDTILISELKVEVESAVSLKRHIDIVHEIRKVQVQNSEFSFIYEAVKEESHRNKIYLTALKVSNLAEDSPLKAVEYAHKEFSVLLTDFSSTTDEVKPRHLPDFVQHFLDRFKSKQEFITPCSEYGFSKIDKLGGGLYPGELTLLMAAPAIGKSFVAQQMAYHNGITLGLPTVYATNEITADQLWLRLCASLTGIPILKYQRNECTNDEIDYFVATMEEVVKTGNENFVILEAPQCSSVRVLQSNIIATLGSTRPALTVLDHLNNMDKANNQSSSESIERSAVDAKRMSQYLHTAVVSPTHTNRSGNGATELGVGNVQYQALTQIADTILSLAYDPANVPAPPEEGMHVGTSGILVATVIRGRTIPVGAKFYLRFDPSYAAVSQASFVDTMQSQNGGTGDYGDINNLLD